MCESFDHPQSSMVYKLQKFTCRLPPVSVEHLDTSALLQELALLRSELHILASELLTVNKHRDAAFSSTGYQSWKMPTVDFRKHENRQPNMTSMISDDLIQYSQIWKTSKVSRHLISRRLDQSSWAHVTVGTAKKLRKWVSSWCTAYRKPTAAAKKNEWWFQ